MDASWPIMMNGCSTGWPPIHVKTRRLATKIQYRIWVIGRMLGCVVLKYVEMVGELRLKLIGLRLLLLLVCWG